MEQLTLPGFKLCRGCGIVKPAEYFASKPYGGKRTRASRCKDCLREWQARYRREHGDRVNANARNGYAADPRRKKASKVAYRERHGEELRERARRKYRIRYAAEPEVWLAANRRRKARLAGSMDALDRRMSVSYRAAIRDDPCFYCGSRIPGDMHDEHYFPLTKGGTDHWWNLVRACGPCNRRKHADCGTRFLLKRGGRA